MPGRRVSVVPLWRSWTYRSGTPGTGGSGPAGAARVGQQADHRRLRDGGPDVLGAVGGLVVDPVLTIVLSHDPHSARRHCACKPGEGGTIKFLESEKKIARLDAYGLASVAMDCRVGAMSDTEKNVHCLMPKSIWVAKR